MTIPSPAIMTRFKPEGVIALRPSTPTPSASDEVVKTKHLKQGMAVRAWFNGQPHGGERVVDTVERATQDGSMWTVTFSSPHPDQTYKAAYRWLVTEPAPEPETGLTHQPFASLSGVLA